VPRPVRAVVFDLDDTLLDHRGSVRTALSAWLPDEAAADEERLVEAWFALERKHYARWEAGQISFQEQRRRRIRELYALLGRPISAADDVDALFADYLAHYTSAWRAFDDVRPTLTQLRRLGFALAVLTNGSSAQQHAKVHALRLLERVDLVVTSEELDVAKPDPRAYRRTCDRVSVDPDEALHVGDRYDVDVVGARAAGLQALHLDRHGRGQETSGSRIASLLELAPRLALVT